MSILFFLIFHNFSAIFILITIFGKVHKPYKQSPTLSPIVMISTILPTTCCMDTHTKSSILFSLTSWSYISFLFSDYNVLVTIFGNVHRPCRYYFIIMDKSPHHGYSFSPFSWLYLHQLLYWEMHTDYVDNASTLSKRATSCLFFFSSFFWTFSVYLQ